MRAVGGKHCAITGIEDRVVFHRQDGGLHGIHRAAARAQHCRPRFHRLCQARDIGRFLFGRQVFAQDDPCPAMDGEMPFRCRRLRRHRGRAGHQNG